MKAGGYSSFYRQKPARHIEKIARLCMRFRSDTLRSSSACDCSDRCPLHIAGKNLHHPMSIFPRHKLFKYRRLGNCRGALTVKNTRTFALWQSSSIRVAAGIAVHTEGPAAVKKRQQDQSDNRTPKTSTGFLTRKCVQLDKLQSNTSK
jgi:hypothetical protein